MSWVLKSTLPVLTGVFCIIFAFMPAAQAQSFAEYHRAPAQAQAPAHPIPGVRYTTGSVTTVGWEKALTDGDPNLKRWNWSAITSYTQSSYNKVPPGKFVKKNTERPSGIYVKPIQISPETYAKKRVQPGVIVVGNTNSRADLSGRVNCPKQVAQAAPAAKSYNSNYGVTGRLRAPKEAESLASRQVYGRLMNVQ